MPEDRTRNTKRMTPQREKIPIRLQIPARPNCPANIASSHLPPGRPQKNLPRQMRPGCRISPQDARALQRRTPLLRQPERGMKRIRNRVFARRHPSFPPRDRRGHRCPPKPRPQTQATYPGAKTRLSRPDMSPVGVAMVPGVRVGPRKKRNAHRALQRIGIQDSRPRILPTRTVPSSLPGRRSGIIPNARNPSIQVVRRLIRRGRTLSPAPSPRSA